MKYIRFVHYDYTDYNAAGDLADAWLLANDKRDGIVFIHADFHEPAYLQLSFRLAEALVPDGTVHVVGSVPRQIPGGRMCLPAVKTVVVSRCREGDFVGSHRMEGFFCGEGTGSINLELGESAIVEFRASGRLIGDNHPRLVSFKGMHLKGRNTLIPLCPQLQVYDGERVHLMSSRMPLLQKVSCGFGGYRCKERTVQRLATFSIDCPCRNYFDEPGLERTAVAADSLTILNCEQCAGRIKPLVDRLVFARAATGKGTVLVNETCGWCLVGGSEEGSDVEYSDSDTTASD